MQRKILARVGSAVVGAAALASCAPSTQLTSSWVDPAAAGRHYQKLVVIAVTKQAALRRMYEDDFVASLQRRSVTGTASYSFATEGQLDRDAVGAKIRELGADGVIVTRVVDQQTVQNYYPPTYTTMAAPSAYTGGWYGYYSLGYTYMSSPGYVTEDHVYRLETNLYDVKTESLAWTGLTETTLSQGSSPEREIAPLIGTIVGDMEKHKLLPTLK